MAQPAPLDDDDVEIIATQCERAAKMHPHQMWALDMGRAARAIRHLQTELELLRALQ